MYVTTVAGPTLFGINGPNVSWISADGPRDPTTAAATTLPGTTLRLLGRSLAWINGSCNGLSAVTDPSHYSTIRAAAYTLQTADRYRTVDLSYVAAATALPVTHTHYIGDVKVGLRASDGHTIALDVTLASCFRLDARVPQIPAGEYTVMLSNGLTNALPVGTVIVARSQHWSPKVFVPGGPLCKNISACVAAAVSAGGGVVQLPAGIVNMSSSTSIALSGRVTLQGAGANETTLLWDSHWTPPAPPHCNGVVGDQVCGCHADGGSIQLMCPDASQIIEKVVFASVGNPTGDCGNFSTGPCAGNATIARENVESACVGKHSCKLTCDIQHFNGGADPCYGVAKSVRVSVRCGKHVGTVQAQIVRAPAALITCSGNSRIAGLTIASTLRSGSVGVAFMPNSFNCELESSRISIHAPGYPISNALSIVSSQSFIVRDVEIIHDNGGSSCGSWPSQCALFVATSSHGTLENLSMVASCAGYSIDSSQSLFIDRMITVSIGNVSSEGQGFSSFRKPQLVQHIYQGRGIDVGNPFADGIDRTNPQHKNSQGRNEAMTLDGPYGLYLGRVDSSHISPNGQSQQLHTSSPPPFAMPGRITAVGAAAIIMQGVGVGTVARVTALSADLRTYTVSPPIATLDYNTSVLSVVSFRGASVWEANAYLNATAFQLFGTSLDVVSAGNFFDNATSGMESFGLYYQGGYQPNYGVLFESNTMRCTCLPAFRPYFFRYGVGLGTNSLGYASCRICRPPPVTFSAPFNRLLHFRRNTLVAGTPMAILGATENCVLDGNRFVSGVCSVGGQLLTGNLTIDNTTTRGIIVQH